MILRIRTYPDPILKKKAKKVDGINEDIRKLIENMFETMYASQGVGLAAPQIGISKQIAVVDVGDGPKVFINPKILKREEKILFKEGCLSVPGVFLELKRAKEIEIEALNEKWEKIRIHADGLLSVCLQQEIDHLKGILIIDRVSLIKQIKLKLFKEYKLNKE